MSETKGEYKTGNPEADNVVREDEQHEIRDESPHNYFTSIPNIVDDMGLSPYAFRLYAHLKRVTGDLGTCWQSTKTLASSCKMSVGMVSKAKQDLMNATPQLIRIEHKHKEGGDWYHEVRIIDVWAENNQKYSPKNTTSSPHERPSSYSELRGSPHETKKNPIKKNQILNNEEVFSSKSKTKTIENAGLDWQLAANLTSEEIASLSAKEQREREVASNYEREMSYNPLPWWGKDAGLRRLLHFLMDKPPEEVHNFALYSKKEFSSLNPAKARQNPDLVIDCWNLAQPAQSPKSELWKDPDEGQVFTPPDPHMFDDLRKKK